VRAGAQSAWPERGALLRASRPRSASSPFSRRARRSAGLVTLKR